MLLTWVGSRSKASVVVGSGYGINHARFTTLSGHQPASGEIPVPGVF